MSVHSPILGRRWAPLRHVLWRFPEWWTYSLCLLGWLALAWHSFQGIANGVHHMSFLEELVHWLLMVYAMMIPATARELRAASFASPWSRRHRSIAGVLTGYTLVWFVAGVPVAAARGDHLMHSSAAPMAFFAIAAIWQFIPLRAFAMVACHREPIPAPAGWTADRDCVMYGMDIGMPCVLSGWPLMTACAFSGHAFVAMVACTLLTVVERRSYRPRPGWPALGAAAFSIVYAMSLLRG